MHIGKPATYQSEGIQSTPIIQRSARIGLSKAVRPVEQKEADNPDILKESRISRPRTVGAVFSKNRPEVFSAESSSIKASRITSKGSKLDRLATLILKKIPSSSRKFIASFTQDLVATTEKLANSVLKMRSNKSERAKELVAKAESDSKIWRTIDGLENLRQNLASLPGPIDQECKEKVDRQLEKMISYEIDDIEEGKYETPESQQKLEKLNSHLGALAQELGAAQLANRLSAGVEKSQKAAAVLVKIRAAESNYARTQNLEQLKQDLAEIKDLSSSIGSRALNERIAQLEAFVEAPSSNWTLYANTLNDSIAELQSCYNSALAESAKETKAFFQEQGFDFDAIPDSQTPITPRERTQWVNKARQGERILESEKFTLFQKQLVQEHLPAIEEGFNSSKIAYGEMLKQTKIAIFGEELSDEVFITRLNEKIANLENERRAETDPSKVRAMNAELMGLKQINEAVNPLRSYSVPKAFRTIGNNIAADNHFLNRGTVKSNEEEAPDLGTPPIHARAIAAAKVELSQLNLLTHSV